MKMKKDPHSLLVGVGTAAATVEVSMKASQTGKVGLWRLLKASKSRVQ